MTIKWGWKRESDVPLMGAEDSPETRVFTKARQGTVTDANSTTNSRLVTTSEDHRFKMKNANGAVGI